ncbi:gamma-glutamyl-gamma-aminobutyrate hydrolase family protein [Iningainema tapete]|uniref:gamma-glutamyl-gamma-aminobutyrate hydrolase family protein n=1 Tax=Iningainema tapete TaxID=2806730 RepID=UPI001EE308DF|nr:gamma-glutamyl-gamma-aminobutyrate hydrolase family protein [Iningainema tapete]
MTAFGVKPPLIGITTSGQQLTGNFSLPAVYANAIRQAGGRPILLPPGESDPRFILELVDGVILSGGGDIDPIIYNGFPHPTIYNIDTERDAFELALGQLLLATDIPVLGICRGLEVLVVADGGNLIPHIPDEFGNAIAHRSDQSHSTEHTVQIIPNSLLANLVGVREMTVVSWHHQAVRTVPKRWRIVAQATDGVIEALENECHPWMLGVQWHPELSINDPAQQGIFRGFVAAAANLDAKRNFYSDPLSLQLQRGADD